MLSAQYNNNNNNSNKDRTWLQGTRKRAVLPILKYTQSAHNLSADVDMPVALSQSSNSTVIKDVLPIKKVHGYTI